MIAAFFADPKKKKIFLIALVSVLVVGAIVVAIVLGGKKENDSSFQEKPQTAETDSNGNPVVTTPSIGVTPDENGNDPSLQPSGADTTPGYGELIRP